MPDIRCGKKWRMLYGGMPASIWLVPDGTNNPVGGDLCEYTSGKPSYKATTPGSPSAENLILRFICLDGRDSDRYGLNSPGVTAATGSVPGMTQIGFQGSRVPDATSKTKPFLPVTPGFLWVMSLDPVAASDTPPVIGASYGVKRIAAGDYVIDMSNAQNVVTIVGVDEEDYLRTAGVAFHHTTATDGYRRYWVKAYSPGGYV